jgi:hypothetical protein
MRRWEDNIKTDLHCVGCGGGAGLNCRKVCPSGELCELGNEQSIKV